MRNIALYHENLKAKLHKLMIEIQDKPTHGEDHLDQIHAAQRGLPFMEKALFEWSWSPARSLLQNQVKGLSKDPYSLHDTAQKSIHII